MVTKSQRVFVYRNAAVFLQRLQSGEKPLTVRTPIGFLAGVDALVAAVTVRAVKTFSTLIAAVRLFSCVDTKVAHVVAEATKTFPALLALIGFLSGVRAHVLFVRL